MFKYSKKYIDHLIIKAIHYQTEIKLPRLTGEALIESYEKTKTKRKNNEVSVNFNDECEQPRQKKVKLSENDLNSLKLVISRTKDRDEFTAEFKSTQVNKIIEEQSDDVISLPSNDISDKANNDTECTITNDIIVVSAENDENGSDPSANDEKMVIDVQIIDDDDDDDDDDDHTSEENTENSNSLIGKIWVRDFSTLVDEKYLQSYKEVFLENRINSSRSHPKLAKKALGSGNVHPNRQMNQPKKFLLLTDVENLYHKYFTQSVQDHIFVIANILNNISLCNIHHKTRMDESFKKKSEAEKLKDRCDANRTHDKQKLSLESKLNYHFNSVVSIFTISEFEPTFQMFFLSILTVLRVLDQPKFKKGSIFKNLVLLLWNSLKDSGYENRRVYHMFKSKTFRHECIELISLIEDSRDHDPGITDRMGLFFLSIVNCAVFKQVTDGIISDVNDLGFFLDEAIVKVFENSSSKAKNYQDFSFTPTSESPDNNKTMPIIQAQPKVSRWLVTDPTGNYQSLPISNENRSQITVSSSMGTIITNRPMNTFYENFSSTLYPSKSSITPKLVCPVAAPISSNNGSSGPPTIIQIKSGIHNLHPVKGDFKPVIHSLQPIKKIERNPNSRCSRIVIDNKEYQVVGSSEVRGIKTTAAKSIVLRTRPTNPADTLFKCHANNCSKFAIIMCSTCTTVKYCSHSCQRKDWYDKHINNCKKLSEEKQARNNSS